MPQIRPSLILVPILLCLLPATGWAQDAFDDAGKVAAWTARLAETRTVVDRVVICFDHASFLKEIGKWDAEQFWPVLLWESDLVPKFISAFGPAEVLLASYARKGVEPGDGFKAVAQAWGAEASAGADTKGLLAVLEARGRAPMGAVLVSGVEGDSLGGLALAAGRLHLPIEFAGDPKERVSKARMEEIRSALAETIHGLGISFVKKFDDLDFVTVANGLAFGYTIDDESAHPGGYTIDDAIARSDDLARWGFVGRLVGGPERSVYMAMGALFLQPKEGLFWSRYDPKNSAFGPFDPLSAVETFKGFFPTEAIRHPDATLARWREVQWPRGNRFGFVFVNSSGGATSWSTSKGGATHFDVPDSVATVVHYTHSGSAGRPFVTDSISGRWLANGAYVYFGSYAEPYLGAFIPPSALAKRVKMGIPLGAAMRHLYTSRGVARRQMKVSGADKVVNFNMTGPWKLAYFGDPSYRLLTKRPDRLKPGETSGGYYLSANRVPRSHGKTGGEQIAHGLRRNGLVLLDLVETDLVQKRAWSRLVKSIPDGEWADAAQLELTRLWIAKLRRKGPGAYYDTKALKKLAPIPGALERITDTGAESADAARLVTEFAKEYIAGIAKAPDSGVGKNKKRAQWVLEAVCSFTHSKGSQKQVYAWVVEAAKSIGVEPAAIKKAVLAEKWIPAAARKAVTSNVK